ncbi:MAG TPA: hypothetical protein VES00_14510, partial [Burkholderiaceae bacterium]|nr:hypothetical protein [Burkholderiaceae bacterium]
MHNRITRGAWKSVSGLVGLLALSLSAACSEGLPDDAVESSSRALGTSVTFEAEALSWTASTTGGKVTTDTGASNNQYVQLTGTP